MASEFFYRNLWREYTPVSSSEHPLFPATETWGRWPSQGWRSLYGAGSAGGTFEVVAGIADQINFKEGAPLLTATLAPGVYTALGFAAQIKAQLDAVGGAPVYTVTYNQTGTSRGKWTIASTANVNLILSVAARSAYPSIGFTTGVDTGMAVTHTGDSAAIHTQETLTEDFGSALDIDGVLIAGHNFQLGATCRVDLSPDNFATIPVSQSFVIQAGIMGLVFPAPHTYQYGRLWIADPDNPDFFVRIGVPFWACGLRPARGYRRGRTRQLKDASLMLSSDNENKTSLQRDRYWPRTWGFNAVKSAEQLLFKAFADYVGLSRDLFFVEDIAHPNETARYLQLTSYSEQFFSGGLEGVYWDIALAAEELI